MHRAQAIRDAGGNLALHEGHVRNQPTVTEEKSRIRDRLHRNPMDGRIRCHGPWASDTATSATHAEQI